MFEPLDKYEFFLRDPQFQFGVELQILQHFRDTNTQQVQRHFVELKTHDEPVKPGINATSYPHTLICRESAQSILQQLWDLGYRPKNGESSLAHVDALKYHLEDMRHLAFGTPPVGPRVAP